MYENYKLKGVEVNLSSRKYINKQAFLQWLCTITNGHNQRWVQTQMLQKLNP